MNISIEYCVQWDYWPQASSLAAVIKQELGITAGYIKSGNGKFEIVVNGELLYSKKATGKFPATNDIVEKLKSLQ